MNAGTTKNPVRSTTGLDGGTSATETKRLPSTASSTLSDSSPRAPRTIHAPVPVAGAGSPPGFVCEEPLAWQPVATAAKATATSARAAPVVTPRRILQRADALAFAVEARDFGAAHVRAVAA